MTTSKTLRDTFVNDKRFVNWKLVTKDGRKTKIPYTINNTLASSTDPATWGTYDEVVMALDNGSNGFSGFGIIFKDDQKLIGIDIDHCMKDGKVMHEQKKIIEKLIKEADTYTEISPSGEGIHLFLLIVDGEIGYEPTMHKKAPYEVYTKGRYFTVTENSLGASKVVRKVTNDEVNRLLSIIGMIKEEKKQDILPVNLSSVLDDEQILNKMFSAKNGEDIKALYNGDISKHGDDDSSADASLCSHLAFWTRRNIPQIERIWVTSPLGQREKIQKRKDYRDKTITFAVNNCSEIYDTEVNKKKDESKKGNKTTVEKIPYKTSFSDGKFLYEMVFDKGLDKTFFIRCDRKNNIEFVDKIVSGKREYLPLPPTHMLVDKSVVLFPSGVVEYINEKELLGEIRAFIHKYVDISEEFEQIASYYVLLTWLYDKFYELPYLRARGDYGSGKTRFLKTIGSISYKAIFTGGATTSSPVFRIIDEIGGTLVLDEADLAKSDMTSDMVKILNSGYQKGSPVLRSEGKGVFEVKAYDVFGPKIIATRESFADNALESRFLVEEMGKSTLRADIPRETRKEFEEEARNIRNKLLKWRLDNYFIDIKMKDVVIEGIHPRLNQIILPLLSIIKDKEAEENLKEFIIKYNDDLIADRGLTKESDIIFAILKLEHEGFNEKLFTVKQISDEVNKLFDNEFDKINPRKMGWYLIKKLQLKTSRTRIGFTLNLDQNRDRINFLKDRYGITDAEIRGEDIESVDVDNIAENIVENNKSILQ